MVRILEHAAWQERVEETTTRKGVKMKTGKYTIAWKGFIKVDPSGKSAGEFEQDIENINAGYKIRFQKVCDELGLQPIELPAETIAALQQGLAEDLRRAYGKDPRDATLLTAVKTLDIIKLAAQFEIEPGDYGWEEDIVRMVRDDMHLLGDEEDGEC